MNLKKNNILTLSRIIFTPVVIGLFYIDFPIAKKIGLVLFMILCTTDLLDGYYARKAKTESKIGQVLDPVADKIMSISILMMLLDFQQISKGFVWLVFVIVFREIFVQGVRVMLGNSSQIRSSKIGKFKSLILNFSLFLFLINLCVDSQVILFDQIHKFALYSLFIAGILSSISGYKFVSIFIQMLEKEK